jgi:hypothetical protein
MRHVVLMLKEFSFKTWHPLSSLEKDIIALMVEERILDWGWDPSFLEVYYAFKLTV